MRNLNLKINDLLLVVGFFVLGLLLLVIYYPQPILAIHCDVTHQEEVDGYELKIWYRDEKYPCEPKPTRNPKPTHVPTIIPTHTPILKPTKVITPTVVITPTTIPTITSIGTPTLTPTPTGQVLATVTELPKQLPETGLGYALFSMLAGFIMAGGAGINEYLKRTNKK